MREFISIVRQTSCRINYIYVIIIFDSFFHDLKNIYGPRIYNRNHSVTSSNTIVWSKTGSVVSYHKTLIKVFVTGENPAAMQSSSPTFNSCLSFHGMIYITMITVHFFMRWRKNWRLYQFYTYVLLSRYGHVFYEVNTECKAIKTTSLQG